MKFIALYFMYSLKRVE